MRAPVFALLCGVLVAALLAVWVLERNRTNETRFCSNTIRFFLYRGNEGYQMKANDLGPMRAPNQAQGVRVLTRAHWGSGSGCWMLSPCQEAGMRVTDGPPRRGVSAR